MTIRSFKTDMIRKAEKLGSIWENFGQQELMKLKEKYKYNPYANQYSNKKEYEVKLAIDELNQ